MSSLMQFRGTSSSRGVDLQFVQIRKVQRVIGEAANVFGPIDYSRPGFTDRGFVMVDEEYTDTFTDPATGRPLPYIWTAPRKPCGMCGCWVVFRYNGEEHVPDLSIPISVEKMPRGAVRLSQEESLKLWHS
jgi:hypothetical protein